MDKIILKIRKEFKQNATAKTRKSFQRFFKEPVRCHGVKTPIVGKIAQRYWKEVEHWSKKRIFALCTELYRSDYCEDAFIVSWWTPKLADQYEPQDFQVFKAWIERHINNWAKCDGFCCGTMGLFLEKYQDFIPRIKTWTRSRNRWLKRAAAVSLINPARRGKFLKDVFDLADRLLVDPDDMVQKGYGWLLKEASRLHQIEVLNYVMRNKQYMPRTALRYAIELMPKNLRQRAMRPKNP
jgi:3-methyladenine DNA glycosylase AlkD